MTHFLAQCFRFILPLVLLLGALYTGISWHVRHQMRSYCFSPGMSILAMGDSHIQTAICDSVIPRVRNIAQTNEGYMYSYYKLVALTRSNPRIDTVILGAGFHNFSDYYDDYIYNPDVSANYFWILPPSQHMLVLLHLENPGQFLARNLWSELSRLWSPSQDTLWLGQWKAVQNMKPPTDLSIQERIRYQFYNGSDERTTSAVNTIWFSRIADWCRDHGMTLLILQTPMMEPYNSLVPDSFVSCYDALMNHHHLEPVSGTGLIFEAEDFLPDGDHLSLKGSWKFSHSLNEILSGNNP